MKYLAFLISMLAAVLVRPCLAAINEADAATLLYYYTAYDLDVEVWGQGKGYIAPACKGYSLSRGRCTLDEFVNYIMNGASSAKPSYYEFESGFSLLIGDVMAIVDGLKEVKEMAQGRLPRVIRGQRNAMRIFDDLAIINDRNYQRAQQQNIHVTRHWTNLLEAMGGLRLYLSSKTEGTFAERMRRYDDALIKIVDREDKATKRKWKMVDWEATVMANPALSDPTSNTYKNTVKYIKGYNNQEGTLMERAMAAKIADTLKACKK
ncbi:hypothetical protein N0V84_009197 [Fusarium piperis]|uniref:Uncharacterized protein n=1 Tax=Fusarium piperis TaxID=1435070 RepID=A0A9W8W6P0_9HYPO|nr:hypothetical protein N0V84_009197 [Fusarium piperis]